MRFVKFIGVLVGVVSSISAHCQIEIDQSKWKEDLKFLKEQISKTVPNVELDYIDKNFASLEANFSALNPEQKIIGMQKVLADFKDEGIRVLPIQQIFNNTILPIKTYWFEDGFYVLDAIGKYSSLINQQIISINGLTIDELFGKIVSNISADNENYKRNVFPFYIQSSVWLKGTGIITDDIHEVRLTLENGQNVSVAFEEFEVYSKLKRDLVGSNESEPKGNYWKSYDANSKKLTVQFQAIVDNDKGDNFSKFINDLKKDLTSKNVDKLIIDNRFGGGGNGFKLKAFTDLIIQDENINQQGKLFVLTSRATRGTVMELTSILELNSKAIFIGEGTGEGPNLVGDIKIIELPNSKIRVSLTHKFWPTSWPEDARAVLNPDLEVSYNFSDHIDQVDPWIEVVKTYVTDNRAAEMPKELLQQLSGKYKVKDYTLLVEKKDEKLVLSMNRKIKSFFEIHTELYFRVEGVLSTDIDQVELIYSSDENENIIVDSLNWKGITLKVD